MDTLNPIEIPRQSWEAWHDIEVEESEQASECTKGYVAMVETVTVLDISDAVPPRVITIEKGVASTFRANLPA